MMQQRHGRVPGFTRVVLAVSLLNLSLAGCFSMRPMEDGRPAPGDDLRVYLTDEAIHRISSQALRAVESVAGTVLQATPDSLVLRVRWGEVAGGSSGRPGEDIVRLGQSDIERIERPQFSLTRTLFLAGGIIAVFLAVFEVAGLADLGDDGDDGGPPQPR